MIRTFQLFLLGLSLSWMTIPAGAAATSADLLLPLEVASPGQSFVAGVRLRMDEGWHTYWKNPGDSGMATEIEWQLPDGITAGEIQWPVPEKYESAGFYTYVYHDEVVLLVPITVSEDAVMGPTEIRATVSWLECQELCLPGSSEVSGTLTIAAESRPSPDAALISEWQNSVPRTEGLPDVIAHWENDGAEDERSLVIQAAHPEAAQLTDFFPFAGDDYEISADTEIVSQNSTEIRLRKNVLAFEENAWPDQVSGIFVGFVGEEPVAYVVSQAIQADGLLAAAESDVAAGESGYEAPELGSLWKNLLFAFLGGLILNIMPCVLPVISLKILGFVQQSKESPERVKMLGLVYGAGVLCSFILLAALVIGVRIAGNAAGWGMQFSSPVFLVLLTLLVTVVALNLFGVFEVNAGSGVMNTASQLSRQEGPSGAFFNGILATILATPCAAPFLAPAVGFALNPSQPNWLVLLFFLTIGIGLAFPYVLLSFQPKWLKFLPKPGAWMERFKTMMGFPMLATAVWLFSISAPNFGVKGHLWLGLFLVLMTLSLWVWGEFVQRGRKGKFLGRLAALGIAVFAVVFVLEGKINWREEQEVATDEGDYIELDGLRWLKWSPETMARAIEQNRPILVNFSADWCLTCHTVVEPAIYSKEVQEELEKLGTILVYGDYTHFPDSMTKELHKFNRAGVPLVLLYGPNSNQPEVIPLSLVAPAFKRTLLNALSALHPVS